MTYQAIEPKVEQALMTAFGTALATAGITAAIRGWWIDDTGTADTEEIEFPQVSVVASPNQPDGYRQPLRRVPVAVTIATFLPDDPARQTLAEAYDAIREVLDTEDLSDTDLGTFPAIDIIDSSAVAIEGATGNLSVVTMQLMVHVCLGAQ